MDNLPLRVLSDPARLRVLYQSTINHSPPDITYNRVSRLAKRLLTVPMAFIHFYDSTSVLIMSQVGLPDDLPQPLPLKFDVCHHFLPFTAPLIIADVKQHPILAESAAVTTLNIASCLAIPLFAQGGEWLGVLSVADVQPRDWLPEDVTTLNDLADILHDHIHRHVPPADDSFKLNDMQRLIEVGPMVVIRWEWRQQWRIGYVSANMLEQFGYNAAELVESRLSYASIVHPEDLERVTKEVNTLRDAKIDRFYQHYRLRHADGSYRWVDDYTLLIRNAQGDPEYYLGYIYDVSERRQIEDELHRSNTRLKSIVDSESAYIVRTDMEARFTFVNTRFRDLMKQAYNREDLLLGADSMTTMVSEDRDKAMSAIEQSLIQPGKPAQAILRKPNPAGDYFYTLWEFVAVLDSAGVPVEIQCVGFDVTEFINTQNALREKDELYRIIVENTTEIIALHDASGRMIYTNASGESQIGYTLDELQAKSGGNLQQMVYAEDLARLAQEQMAALAAKKTDAMYTYRIHGKDGNPIWLETRTRYRYDETGNLHSTLNVSRDITERIRAQEALRAKDELYRVIVENTTDIISMHEISGKALFANGGGLVKLGFTSEEMMAMTGDELWALVHPDDLERVQQEQREYTKNQVTDPIYIYRMVRKDGSFFWVEDHTHYIYDENGNAVSNITINRDITERMVAEEELRRNEERYRSLMQWMSDFVFLAQKSPDTGEMFLVWHEGNFEKVFGLPVPENIQKWQETPMHPDDRERTIQDIERTLAGESTSTELRIRHAQGHYVWVRTSRLPIVDQASGQVTGYYGVVQDISDEHDAEELRLEGERLSTNLRSEQSLNQAIRRVVSAVSHDIRTPLAVISTSKDMLNRYYDRLTDERRRSAFETIEKQLGFISRMLDDMAQVIKGSMVDGTLNLQPVNLERLCSVAVNELQQSIGQQHQLKFEHDWHHDTVMLDETLINRVLFNLVSNAIKFSPRNSQVMLSLTQQDRRIVIRVSDQGIGIPPEEQKKVFEVFYRAGNSQTIEGTGLGLAIVQECVQRHSGSIRLESEVGVGTTFIVELPLIVDRVKSDPA